ncbi:uncharacterized SAM-binding protein YcdF (DUF218 family) [Aneurinibacillus soli]|uniref:Uncharacterized protein n=1 Tax=Aneurinibacillus soli TaxID=1500254 RepID=A0A0U4WHD4_9BACL|nr:YdcF family protein [Aneurinibacillus soli]PYE64139.1 uncharacterized SAM-binding protein YcdF (DUF218 family) [Aneurinibacillus soli]BAU28088.1 hypothetical protein CB4_02262 [Aneurinibacillus soli]
MRLERERTRRRTRAKSYRRIAYILSFAVLIFSVLFWREDIVKGIAQFLIVQDNPKKSDAVLVLGGEHDKERTKRAAQLFHAGYAVHYVVSDGGYNYKGAKITDEMAKAAELYKVPRSVIVMEDKALSTYDNAVYTRQLMEKEGWKSAIVVTSNWHTRRAKMTFDKVYKDSGITLSYASAEDTTLENWWGDLEKSKIVLKEWVKIIFYKVRY